MSFLFVASNDRR